MKKTFRRTFLTGLAIALPVAVTFWVLDLGFSLLASAITPMVEQAVHAVLGRDDASWVGVVAPGLSLILMITLIFLLGLIGGNVLGAQLIRGIEALVMHVPVVRTIYSGTRQFIATFSSGNKQAFSRVVLVEYPRHGLWTMAFLTNDVTGEVGTLTHPNMVSVFVPTTPNPTSGWLLFVEKKDTIDLSMSVDDAFKMIISGGVLTPPYREG